jgi:lipopolysaccharide export system protein LptA
LSDRTVLKKSLQIITTLALLVFGHAVYVRAFAVVMVLVGVPDKVTPLPPLPPGTSSGARKAEELAHLAFGDKHWTSNTKELFMYYEPLRGFWLFAKGYEQSNSNKRLKLRPFAMIWRSHEGGPIKTLSAAEATIDFDQPIGPGQSGSSAAHMVKGRVDGDIVIRNDKATPGRLDDDMVIDRLTHLEFDEKALVVKSDSSARIADKGIRITGTSLVIDLWPREPGQNGFDPKTAKLLRDVVIEMADVGQSGIVPGVSPTSPPPSGSAERVAKPAKLTCRGEMVVTLPKAEHRVKWGPPAPKGPTLAEFSRDVVVTQGLTSPDQLYANHLLLTLVQAEKAAPVGRADPANAAPAKPQARDGDGGAEPQADNALGSLELSKARATGHDVWLVSPTQGMRNLCQELIHERRLPAEPDVTYLRADRNVWVEKIGYITEGPDKGKIQSLDIMETMDITIYQYGTSGMPPTMVARGPGRLDTRPDRGKPIERWVSWTDRLDVRNEETAVGERRKITIVGMPKVHSLTQKAKIEAEDTIIAYLKPNDRTAEDAQIFADGAPVANKAEAKAGAREGDTMKIDWLVGARNVVLETLEDTAPAASGAPAPSTAVAKAQEVAANPPKSPGKKTVKSRDRLDVSFTDGVRPKPQDVPPNAPSPQPPPPSAPPAQQVLAANGAPAPSAPPAATASPRAAEAAEPEPEQEPPVVAEGDRASAIVVLYPKEGPPPAAGQPQAFQGNVEKARLIGHVAIHQGAAPGNKHGTDLTADEASMEDQGNGLAEFHAQGTIENPAVAITETGTIKGPFLGLDQAGDYAWSSGGPGMLIEHEREPEAVVRASFAADDRENQQRRDSHRPADGSQNLSGKDSKKLVGVEKSPKDSSKESAKRPAKPRGPMTVTWQRSMKFWGKTKNEKTGEFGPATAHFFEDVKAWTRDSSIVCSESMVAMLDNEVSLQKRRGAAADAAEADDGTTKEARISWLKCLQDVEINRYTLDPASKVLMGRQEILGDDVYYDVQTGDFDIQGAGLVRRYEWKPEKEGAALEKNAPADGRARPLGARGVVRPVSDSPARGRAPGRSAAQKKAKTGDAAKTKTRTKPAPSPVQIAARGPELTRITFQQRCKGRFGGDVDGGQAKGPSEATFWGDILVLKARVAGFQADLDPDAETPPPDLMRLNCKTLLVESTPITPKADASSASAERDKRATANTKAETSRSEMTAWGEVAVQDGNKTLQGDRMTEDSEKGLMWLYGERNLAILTQQPVPGATPTRSPGSAVWYNRKTGNAGIVNARDFEITIDPKNESQKDRDARRLAGPGASDVEPKRKPRNEPRLPPRADKERQGFRGR